MGSILITSILLIVSLIFKFFPPKKVNKIYGYRTPKSMKNEDNWKLANDYSSTFMSFSSAILLLLSIGFNYIIPQYTLVITVTLLICIIGLMIYMTETKLKN